jgi:membrane-associated phospholipid phosphatase
MRAPPMPRWKILAYATIAAAACVFALIAGNIAAGDPLAALDLHVTSWLGAHRTPALTLLMLAVTHTQAPLPICAYASIMAVVLYRKSQRRWLLALALAVPAGLTINVLLKYLFRRSRPVPDEPLMTLATYGFPSGHTAGATLFYGVLTAYVVSQTRSTRVRTAAVLGWVCTVALVAFSRVYLGVHYLTDVVAAAAWSGAWLGVCLLVASRTPLRSGSGR